METNKTEGTDEPITRAEVQDMITEALSGLKIYVAEADITAAQQTVQAIVQQASF
jgi:hypothetical protein